MENRNLNFLKRIIKSFTCGALISSMGFCPIMHTYASSVLHGGAIYTTYNGISYDMKNKVFTGLESDGYVNRKYARAATDISASQNVFNGALGARAVLCYSNGNIAVEGSWVSSGSASAGISSVVSKTYSMNIDPGSFCSHGYARFWNGSSYNTYQPVATGNLADYSW